MFRFNFEKALQAVGVMLRTEPSHRMNYMRMLKLLYICEKESLAETGHSITGDKVVAMERGPVLSHLYDLIKGTHYNASAWNRFIERDRYEIMLKEEQNPGTDLLNKFEIETINAVSERYHQQDEFDMVHLTHEFPEWKKNDPGKSSKPIPLDDILEAINRKDDAEAIKKDADLENHLMSMFEG